MAKQALQRLNDPTFDEAGRLCVSCGYSLDGLALPAPCPECGLVCPKDQLTLFGVVDPLSTMSPTRFAAIIAIGVIGAIVPTIIQATLLFGGGWVAALSVFGVFVLAAVMLVITSPKSGGGAWRILIRPGGFATAPINWEKSVGQGTGSGYTPVSPNAAVLITRAGAVWARITIRDPEGKVQLKAGFRCPSDRLGEIYQQVRAIMLSKTGGGAANGSSLPPTQPIAGVQSDGAEHTGADRP